MIVVNFKLYPQTFGDGALKLAQACIEISQKTGVKIIPAVSSLDFFRLKSQLTSPFFLQHLDSFLSGPKSGFISPLQAQALGVDGSLINHSEHRLPPGTISQILAALSPSFTSVVCLQNQKQASSWAKKIHPTFFAYEPKEFIGNRHTSVATAKPDTITKIASLLPHTPLLVGAGVHSREDVQISLRLGARGIIVATDVVTAPDPRARLLELASGFSV